MNKAKANDRSADLDIVTGLFRLSLTPAVLRRLMLVLTRLHYQNPTHYPKGTPDSMRELFWTKDPKTSKLRIELGNSYPGNEQKGHTDAVYIDMMDITFSKQVVENYAGVNERKDVKQYVKQASTNVILRHVMKDYDMTTEFAFMTGVYFSAVRDMVMRDGDKNGVKGFELVQQLVPRSFNKSAVQSDELFVSDIIVSVTWNLTWNVITESHTLKSWQFANLEAKMGDYQNPVPM